MIPKTLRFLLLLTLLAALLPPWTPAHAAPGQPPRAPDEPLPPAGFSALTPLAQAAEETPPPQPGAPKQFLARLTADADPQAVAEFLREMREQDRIGEFSWVEESRAFLIAGEKGLPLVVARPEVWEILEATPETLALPPLQEQATPEQPERAQPLAESAPVAQPGPGEMTQQEPKDTYLIKLSAPGSVAEVGMAYEHLRFELDYLHQQEQIGAHEWLPEANAVRAEIIVPQVIDFLQRLSEVDDVLPYAEETLDQAQQDYQAALTALHRDAARFGIAHATAYTPTQPRARARLYTDYLYLSGNSNASTVVTLTTSTGALKNDPARTSVSYSCDWYYGTSCWAYVYLRDANYNAVAMTPGDILYVAQSGQTPFSMTIPLLTAYADANANTVSGQAPPNITNTDPNNPPVVQVSVSGGQYVTTTAEGTYLATNVGDFLPGSSGEVLYYDARGNQTYLPFRVPMVSVRGYDGYSSEQRVAGYAPLGNITVTIELRRGGVITATWSGTAGSDGYFSAYLSQSIAAGDEVRVTAGEWDATVHVPLFTAESIPETDMVVGQTDAVVVTTTYNLPRTLAVWPQTYSDSDYSPRKRVQPDAGGVFTATNPFERYGSDVTIDIRSGDAGHLRYIDAAGNRTYFRFKAPSPPPVLYARGWGSESRYYAGDTLGGTITGWCSSEDGYGVAELHSASGTLKARVTSINACPSFGVDFYVPIEGSDVISATFGGQTTVMTVPRFEVTVDPASDMIIGQTDATVVTTTYGLTQTLAVWPNSYYDYDDYPRKRVQPGAGGIFTATNPFERYGSDVTVDIRPGDAGHLRYIDAAGNRTYFRFKAPSPPPVLYARGWGSGSYYKANDTLGGTITGFCSSEDGYGVAVLRSASGTLKAQATNVNACPSFGVDFNVPIVGGDVISATFGGQTTVMTVPRFEVTVDPASDMIIGQTDATVVTTTYGLTQTLAVWPKTYSDDYPRKRVQPDAGGVFMATNPFEGYSSDVTVDIRPGDAGHLCYIDAAGNRTYAAIIAPGLYVRGDSYRYVADNYVFVRANAGLLVTVTLKRDGATAATASGQIPDSGEYGVYLTDAYGAPVLIQAGDVVEAALSGRTLTATMPVLTAIPHTATGIVSGIAPANITDTTSGNPHTLRVYRSRDGRSLQVTTDASGAYSADFSSYGGLRPGDVGYLRYINHAGYYIYDNYWVPVVYVRGYESGYSAENYVSGYVAEAGVVITVTLRRDGEVVARTFGRSNGSDGSFSIYLRDRYGYDANILGGDTVEVQTAGGTVSVYVPRFTVFSDPLADRVTGSTDAVVTSQTPYMTQTLAVWPTYSYYWDYGKHVLPTGGVFTATNPFYYGADPATSSSTTLNWGYGTTGHARYINADGHRVYMRIQAPIKPEVHVRGYYQDNRYYAENSVGGRVEGFCGYGTVTLRDSAGAVKAQTTSAWACYSIYAFLYDAAGNPAPILPGDRVEVTFGGATTVVQVPAFTVTSDPVNDRLTGTTDALVGAGTVTQTLSLWPASFYDSDEGKRVTVDAGGAFTATNPFYRYADPSYSPVTLDWTVGEGGHLRYVDAEGNRVYARFRAYPPQATLTLRGDYWEERYVAENYLSGYFPGFCGEGTVMLRNATGALKGEWRRVRACSEFSLYLYGEGGAAVNLEAGDVVTATFGTSTVTVSIPTFAVETDHVRSRVTGTTNAAVTSTTPGMTQTLAIWPTSYYDSDYGKHVQPTGGVFTATNPFYRNANPARGQATLGLTATSVGHLRYVDGTWNRVYARFHRPDILLYVHQCYSEEYYGYYSEYSLSVQVPGFCGYGSIVLRNAAGTLKAQRTDVYACSYVYAYNAYLHDNAGQAVPIEAGDRVEANFGGRTKMLIVPYLSARADAALDRVTGATNADMSEGASLTVYPTSVSYEDSYSPSKSVQPDASGAFTATNPFYYHGSSTTWVDIREGDQGHVRYVTPAGDRVQYRLMAEYPAPRVWVRKDSYYLYGYSFPRYVPITTTLRRGGNTIATAQARTDGIGYFYAYLRDAAGNYVYIREGDVVRVEAPGIAPIEVPVVRLTAQADAEQDAIWGYGPPNALLTVGNSAQPFPTGTDGAYRADLRGLNDLQPGNSYSVNYRNADGHTVYISQYVGPYVNAVLHSNYLWGYSARAGVGITATLKSGATVKGTASGSTYGYFSLNLLDTAGNPALIAPGDTLEVELGGEKVTLPIVALTAQVNPTTGEISGTGPANAWLGVDVDGRSPDRSVKTDSAGRWATQVLDFYASADVNVRVFHANAQGHRVWLYTRVRPPVVYVRGTSSGFSYTSDRTVSGYADGYALVNLRLLRGGATVVQQNIVAYSYGWYNTTFTESIRAGDQVVVQWVPRAPITVTVPTMTASANAGNSTVSGVGPANARIGVLANGYSQFVTTSATGAFEVGMPLVTGRESIYLSYQTPEGHWVHARTYYKVYLPLVLRQ